MKTLLTLTLIFCLLSPQVSLRGKTYDDLDDILKHEGLNSTKTHIAYKEPLDEGAHIDPSKVVHMKPKIQEEKAMTSGYVIPKGYSTNKSSNKTYEQYAKKSAESTSN